MKVAFVGIFLIASIVLNDAYIVDPGPVVIATRGAVWPKPAKQNSTERFVLVRPSVLQFKVRRKILHQYPNNDTKCMK